MFYIVYIQHSVRFINQRALKFKPVLLSGTGWGGICKTKLPARPGIFKTDGSLL